MLVMWQIFEDDPGSALPTYPGTGLPTTPAAHCCPAQSYKESYRRVF